MKENKIKMSEKAVMGHIRTILTYAENCGKLVFFRNNVGKVVTRDNRFFQTGKKGFGDFIFGYYDRESRLMVYGEAEAKGDGGKQSIEQISHQKQVEKLGGLYVLVTPENLTKFDDYIKSL